MKVPAPASVVVEEFTVEITFGAGVTEALTGSGLAVETAVTIPDPFVNTSCVPTGWVTAAAPSVYCVPPPPVPPPEVTRACVVGSAHSDTGLIPSVLDTTIRELR